MVTFQEGLADNVRQGLCNTLNIAERTAQLGSRFYDTIGLRPIADTSEQAAQLWSNAAAVACNRPSQDLSGQITPPFVGGQCPGTWYRVNGINNANGIPFSVNRTNDGQNLEGPIQGIREIAGDGGFRWVVVGGNGEAGIASSIDPDFFDGQITSVVPILGPDDCGDPPPQGPPYSPSDFTVPRTINYDDNGGTPRSTDVDIVYGPTNTGPGGDFVVPFEIEFEDGSSLFGDFNLSTGDINFGGGNSGGDGVTDEPTELEDGQEDVPDGLVVVGCRVIVAIDEAASRATEIFGDGSAPNLFVPRLGTIRFRFEAPGGGPTLGPDISVKQRNELFWSGPPCLGVAIQEDIGSQFTVRLVVVKESAVGLFGGGGST